MTYRTILAAASGETEDAALLAVGAALASRYAALLRVVPAFPDPAADLAFYGLAGQRAAKSEAVQQLLAAERETQARIERLALDAGRSAGLSMDVSAVGAACETVTRDLSPAIALAQAAVLADLVLFSGDSVRRTGAIRDIFAETLINTRAPTLLVKSDRIELSGVAIAWDASAQAGRALRAALPLLMEAKRVVVLQNRAELTPDRANTDALRTYLARHGVRDAEVAAVVGDNVAASLLSGAKGAGCDVLVAGGYGRPRLYELALGGTTRSLVNAQGGPHILLAH